MKQENIERIKNAVFSHFPEKDVRSLCQEVLKDEVFEYADGSNARKAISKIIDALDISVCEEMSCNGQESGTIRILRKYSPILSIIFCATVYWIFCVFVDSFLLGWMISIVISALFYKALEKSVKKEERVDKSEVADMLLHVLDGHVFACRTLLEHKTIEIKEPGSFLESRPYKYLLKQVFDDVQEADSREQKALTRLLEDCGCELIEYSEEYGEYFDKFSANIPELKTTVKALINRDTKSCIFMGSVVFPNK